MRVLVSWLREMVDLPADVAEIARRLTMAGLEVEAIDRLDRGLEGVVVGEVRERTPIEGTKLSVCRVFDGAEELQIVCGAQNYAAGDHVPLAKVGAVLPDGKSIGRAKLRGIESSGMLCSSRELGSDDGVDGLMILPRETKPGTPIAQVIGRDDVALELNVTPNRADALGHLGVARELATLFGTAVRAPEPAIASGGAAPASVEIDDATLCPRYAARVLEGARIGPSPAWMRRRLEALGQRSVNNVVDATNIVLFELGQPMHAFDLDRVAGGRIVVRRARAGETMKTLDGKDRPLHADDLCICDAERPIALAGVMGGEDSEVKDGTTRLLLESAFFLPTSVRRSAKRHGIHSEASHRFERGVDPEGIRRALDRLTALLVDVAGARVVGGPVDVVAKPHVRARVSLRHSRLDALLGTSVPWAEARGILERLGLAHVSGDDKAATYEIPGARLDLGREEDLIEEVARVRGFDRIAPKVPPGSGTDAAETTRAAADRRIREGISAGGFDEAMNLAFVSPEETRRIAPDIAPIVLRNPLSHEQSALRTSLLPALLRNVSHNLRHGAGTVRLYEIGRVYLPLTTAPTGEGNATFRVTNEPTLLALAAVGRRGEGWTAGRDAYDFYDLKGAVELALESAGISDWTVTATRAPHLHPRASAAIVVGGRTIGTLGELHPTVADAVDLPRGLLVAELDLDAAFAAATLVPRYTPLPRFPASLRDMAIVVAENVTVADVLARLRAADPERFVENAQLFDVYRGQPLPEGRKNLAFSLRYRAPDRTLTDEDVNRLHAGIVQALQQAFGAELRA